MSEKAGILERTATVRGPSGAANSVTPLTFRFAHNGAQYPEPERLMSNKPVNGNGRQPARDRIHAEMLDSFEEELELEIDDDRLDALTSELSGHPAAETVDRKVYFKELFRLQGELVKLQSWVQQHKLKVVVIFEGRDSAGKGGVIKRITQRLNPRVCRVAALPAPNERERTPMVFPALRHASAGRRRNRAVRPQLVQPRRRRESDGVLHRT